jgi:exo-beta-1,3-glucanase (GH17 family)
MKRFKIVVIFFILLVLNCFQMVGQQKNTAYKVLVSEEGVTVNGNKYLIKGVCYNPVPKGSNNRSFETLTADLTLMVEAGINTLRVYTPIDNELVLNEIEKAGLKVIISFGYNQNGKFDILSGTFKEYVTKYKNHKAILFWELGNEYNYHPEWFNNNINNWYKALNNAAQVIHQIDENRPVATAHGELPTAQIVALCPDIDIWGMNVYRWDQPATIFSEWSAISNKPMYFSEAGADSFMTISKDNFKKGVNEEAQATATNAILKSIFSNQQQCLGVTLFSFNDELWKAGNNQQYDAGGWAPNSSGVPYDGTPNEEYWGIVDIDRNKKQAFYIVKEFYTKKI